MNTGLMDKIRKLSALAERAGTVHEAAVASAKLNELLLRHNLSMRDVNRAVLTDKYTKERVTIGGKDNWRRQLYYTIARNNFCEMVYTPRTQFMTIVGEQENIDATIFMYDRLHIELMRLCEEEYRTFKALGNYEFVTVRGMRRNPETGKYERIEEQRAVKVHGKTWKNSFFYGAVSTISKMLREQREQFTKDAETNALVIDREDELQRALFELMGKTQAQSQRTRHNSAAYSAGQRAAGRINFNESVSGGRAALGSGR